MQRFPMRWILAIALAVVAGVTQSATPAASNFVHTIYLVRHGSYNPDPKADPDLGPSLNTLGIGSLNLSRLIRDMAG